MQNNSFIELKKNCLSGEQMQDLNADSNWMEPWSNGAQGKKLSVCWSYGSAFTSFLIFISAQISHDGWRPYQV